MDINSHRPGSFQINLLSKEIPVTVFTSMNQLDNIHTINHVIDLISPSSNKIDDYRLLSKVKHDIKLGNRRSMLSISSGETDKDRSIFSSLSNYTNLTIPDDEDKVSDLNRQIEELQNQVTVTQERNRHVENKLVSTHKEYADLMRHLMTVQDTQDELINVLENRCQSVQATHNQYKTALHNLIRDLEHLSLDRNQLTQMFSVIEKTLFRQEESALKAIEGLEHVKSQWTKQRMENASRTNYSEQSTELEQVDLLRSQRDRFYHQWKQQIQHSEKAQQSLELQVTRCNSLEKRTDELENDLNISQELLRQQDTSGRIQRLEQELKKVKHQKQMREDNFEKSYQDSLSEIKSMKQTIHNQTDTIKDLQSTNRVLHQQLSDSVETRQSGALSFLNPEFSSSGVSIVSTYGDPDLIALKEKIEQEERIERLSSENSKLKAIIQGAKSHMATESHQFTQKIRTLEKDVKVLTAINSQLDRTSRNSQGSIELNQRANSVSLSQSCSNQSDLSEYKFNRQRASSVGVSPLFNLPTQPIPPLPPTSPGTDRNTPISIREDSLAHLEIKLQQQQQDIEMLLQKQTSTCEELKSAKEEIERIGLDLQDETNQKLKAEKACRFLERKAEEAMDKKNKYCIFTNDSLTSRKLVRSLTNKFLPK